MIRTELAAIIFDVGDVLVHFDNETQRRFEQHRMQTWELQC